jgi:Spy/CpxP family protein refolding chaperone
MSTLVAPPKSAKATLCASFALIFLCGAVTGALVMNFSRTHTLIARHDSAPGHFGSRFELQHLHHELDLTDEQTRQLSMILDDVAKYYDNVLSDGQTRVMQILDEKQKAKFQQLLATEGH